MSEKTKENLARRVEFTPDLLPAEILGSSVTTRLDRSDPLRPLDRQDFGPIEGAIHQWPPIARRSGSSWSR